MNIDLAPTIAQLGLSAIFLWWALQERKDRKEAEKRFRDQSEKHTAIYKDLYDKAQKALGT